MGFCKHAQLCIGSGIFVLTGNDSFHVPLAGAAGARRPLARPTGREPRAVFAAVCARRVRTRRAATHGGAARRLGGRASDRQPPPSDEKIVQVNLAPPAAAAAASAKAAAAAAEAYRHR